MPVLEWVYIYGKQVSFGCAIKSYSKLLIANICHPAIHVHAGSARFDADHSFPTQYIARQETKTKKRGHRKNKHMFRVLCAIYVHSIRCFDYKFLPYIHLLI